MLSLDVSVLNPFSGIWRIMSADCGHLATVLVATLMRSSDPSQEFTDMPGKTLAIEWLIENAPAVFPTV